jgi:N6-adenosine-specific RNA methylase IME4
MTQKHPNLAQFLMPYTCLFCGEVPMPAAYMACGRCTKKQQVCVCCQEPILDGWRNDYRCIGCLVLKCADYGECQKFHLVLADPSWDYGWAWGNGAAAHTYHTSPLEEMMRMNPAALCRKDAHMIMWTTGAFWEHAGILMRAWGFTPKSIAFTWVKVYSDGSLVMNPGQHTRQNIEPTRLGFRGDQAPMFADNLEPYGDTRELDDLAPLGTRGAANRNRVNRSVKQVIMSKRGERHSEKPPEANERCETLLGPEAKYLEMFRVGAAYSPLWKVFGNEAEHSIMMPTHEGTIYQMPPAIAKKRTPKPGVVVHG